MFPTINCATVIGVSKLKRPVRCGNVVIPEHERHWVFDGCCRHLNDSWHINVHIDDLGTIGATDLRTAMRRYTSLTGTVAPDIVVVDGGHDAKEDLEWALISGVSFELDPETDDFVMRLHLRTDEFPGSTEKNTGAANRLAPLLSRHRMWLVDAAEAVDSGGQYWEINIRVGFHTRSRTMASLAHVGLDAVSLLYAVTGQMSRDNIIDLLRTGNAKVLIGQPEGQWLEAKQQHYRLHTDEGQIKLARAVAQFANAPDGGLVIIGLATAKRGGVDAINAVTPLPQDSNIRRRYVQHLQNRIYPTPDGMRVERIPVDGGELIAIDIPPQRAELMPFLIHGAVIGGRVNNAFISIVERRDDEGLADSIASIHSTLVAGRALLRHGLLPMPRSVE